MSLRVIPSKLCRAAAESTSRGIGCSSCPRRDWRTSRASTSILFALDPRSNYSASFQVLDQYLSFIAPSPSLFSLLPPATAASASTPSTSQTSPLQSHSTYTILNSPASSEQQIEEEIERVASGLFSVVATMGARVCCLFSLFTKPISRTRSNHTLSER